jgi:hypothetical protein
VADAVAEKRETLKRWLQTAIELELATIPPYMIALLSIKLPTNREAADLIRGVMIEEMLHLALVANVLNAVGGQPKIDETVIPHYPLQLKFQGKAFEDRDFPINLEPFSANAIATFMKIEQPELPPERLTTLEARLDVPAFTIGEFYRNILGRIAELDKAAPGALFTGNPDRQIHKDYYWSGGGEVVIVTDLATATQALNIVINQGEAAWPHPRGGGAKTGFGTVLEMGHYYRFSEIFHRKRYRENDDPDKPPTGGSIAVDFDASYPVVINPTSADYPKESQLAKLNDAFNARYTGMMLQLNEAVGGTPKALYTAIMNGMHALTPIAHEMMKIPLDLDPQRVGCPTFEWFVEG